MESIFTRKNITFCAINLSETITYFAGGMLKLICRDYLAYLYLRLSHSVINNLTKSLIWRILLLNMSGVYHFDKNKNTLTKLIFVCRFVYMSAILYTVHKRICVMNLLVNKIACISAKTLVKLAWQSQFFKCRSRTFKCLAEPIFIDAPRVYSFIRR